MYSILVQHVEVCGRCGNPSFVTSIISCDVNNLLHQMGRKEVCFIDDGCCNCISEFTFKNNSSD